MAELFPEVPAGGFSRADGTVAFWTRVQALTSRQSVVLDYGAGRGLADEDKNEFRRDLQRLRGRAARVIGVDVDPVVLDNPLLDEAYQLTDHLLPLPDQSVDLVVANSVFEHIEDRTQTARELDRVLRAGGWICARTPNRFGYIALGATLVPNNVHVKVLSKLQPKRRAEDVFPTVYAMNSMRALKAAFPEPAYTHHSFRWNGDPSYFGSSARLRAFIWRAHQVLPQAALPMMMVFIRKAPALEQSAGDSVSDHQESR